VSKPPVASSRLETEVHRPSSCAKTLSHQEPAERSPRKRKRGWDRRRTLPSFGKRTRPTSPRLEGRHLPGTSAGDLTLSRARPAACSAPQNWLLRVVSCRAAWC